MKEIYEKLTQYEKRPGWKNRFGSLYRLYMSKLYTRLLKDGKTWIFNVLMLLPIFAGPIVAIVSDNITADNYMSLYSDIMFMGYFGIIIPLFTMYIASMMFSDEMGDRSITYLTVRPIKRFELIIVKYLSYLSIVPIFVILVTFLNYIAFGVVGEFTIPTYNMFWYYDMALWFLLTAFISSAVYGALFMFIGLLFKNPLWFGLFFVFIWEFVLASFSQTLNKLTVGYYIKSLIVFDIYRDSRDSPAIFFGNQAYEFDFYFSPAKALSFSIVLLVVIIISITLAWAVLQGDKFRIPYKAGTRPGGWKYYLKEIRSYLITFSILFITLGAVFGPVNGIKKDSTEIYNGDIFISNNYWWYDNINPEPPDLDQMGWGHVEPYTLTKGDDVNITYSIQEVSGVTSYLLKGVICTEEAYDSFYRATQQRWLEYAVAMDLLYLTSYYNDLIYDYQVLAASFVNNATENVTFNAATSNSITFTAEEKGNYYLVVLPQWFNFGLYDEVFIGRNTHIFVQGEVFRRTGYSFGYVLLGVGLISLGFASYSLATYDSAIEIQRYNEQVAKYNGNNTKQGKLDADESKEQ
ncbi:MAG: ABC transporter permease [Asgard group archaeon]|nr:ABC transporter permease [Asgard group archaeon]